MTEELSNSEPPKNEFAPEPTRGEVGSQTLVLVESDVLVRIPLADYLRGCGYRVIECTTAEEAMALLDSGESVDIVLSDVALTGQLNGFALAKWARQDHPGVKVVLASGVTNLASTSEKVCADGPIVPKPYSYETLLAHLRRLRPRS